MKSAKIITITTMKSAKIAIRTTIITITWKN